MKKIFFLGAVCLALSATSCKTYCPAYNYAKLDKQTTITGSSAITAEKASASIKS